jgi:hypothetical protein
METTQTTPVVAKPVVPTLAELFARIEAITAGHADLAARIAKFEADARPSNKSDREMTDDDAKRILNGDLKDLKHNDAAKKLGLSYGQIYSARGEYTFRHVHTALKAQGFKNPWKKA